VVSFVGIITTKGPSAITDRIIKRCVDYNIKIIVAVNTDNSDVLQSWRGLLNVNLVHGSQFQTPGYTRNLILKYMRSNFKGESINLLLLDDDMLPSLASYQALKRCNCEGIYVPRRREYVNQRFISSDYRNTVKNNNKPITRIGGSVLIVGQADKVVLYPNNEICEEETIFCLKNILVNKIKFRHYDQIHFSHLGQKNNKKSLRRFARKPRIKLIMLYIFALIRGFSTEISGYDILKALK